MHEPATTAKMIGNQIRAARKKRGLSQDALAALIDVAQPTVSQFERGIASPAIETIAKLTKALNVSVQWLITGEGEMEFTYPQNQSLFTSEPIQQDEEQLLALYKSLTFKRRKALLEFLKEWK